VVIPGPALNESGLFLIGLATSIPRKREMNCHRSSRKNPAALWTGFIVLACYVRDKSSCKAGINRGKAEFSEQHGAVTAESFRR